MINRRNIVAGLAGLAVLADGVRASVLTDSLRSNAQSIITTANEIDAQTPPPPLGAGGKIAWPRNNQVIQKKAGVASFKAQWRGDAQSVRLMSGAIIVAENATGQFNTIAPGWYSLALVNAGEVCDQTNVGVGNVVITAGQSNGYSPREPDNIHVFANAPGRIIVSDNEGQGVDSFVDANSTLLRHSICWIHCFNTLARAYPTMIINRCVGSTSTYQWRYNGEGLTPPGPLTNNVLRDILTHEPQAILWHQGETLSPTQWGTEYDYMNQMHEYLNRVSTTPWLMALNSYPSGGAIRTAQQQIINQYPHIFQGPDTDPFRSLAPGNSHFQSHADPALDGIRKVGEAWATSYTANGF